MKLLPVEDCTAPKTTLVQSLGRRGTQVVGGGTGRLAPGDRQPGQGLVIRAWRPVLPEAPR